MKEEQNRGGRGWIEGAVIEARCLTGVVYTYELRLLQKEGETNPLLFLCGRLACMNYVA